jgi:uncharacterized membrane protein (DUF2068 family)
MSATGKIPYNHTHGYLKERPRLLTILCIKHFILTLIGFAGVLSPQVKHAGMFYPSALGIVISIQFISLIGIWHLKRWGVHLFTYSVIVYAMLQIILERTGLLGYDIFWALFLLITCLVYYKRMDSNL